MRYPFPALRSWKRSSLPCRTTIIRERRRARTTHPKSPPQALLAMARRKTQSRTMVRFRRRMTSSAACPADRRRRLRAACRGKGRPSARTSCPPQLHGPLRLPGHMSPNLHLRPRRLGMKCPLPLLRRPGGARTALRSAPWPLSPPPRRTVSPRWATSQLRHPRSTLPVRSTTSLVLRAAGALRLRPLRRSRCGARPARPHPRRRQPRSRRLPRPPCSLRASLGSSARQSVTSPRTCSVLRPVFQRRALRRWLSQPSLSRLHRLQRPSRPWELLRWPLLRSQGRTPGRRLWTMTATRSRSRLSMPTRTLKRALAPQPPMQPLLPPLMPRLQPRRPTLTPGTVLSPPPPPSRLLPRRGAQS
ncbi:hypothetical protein CALCODRAFT_298411 [Calocera cornea HHB12733]|uniref:Uncharacterized protein n=1 Tax=Calocera cornea HHB12733 TaxID=1353952 RepID=A0A165FMU5_9BASI|nr:hypothetical protein CALCODRAFT_298411 [Calocera cornea HHB12733]